MHFLVPGLIGLVALTLQGAVMFGIVYGAVRLALRHDRDASS